MADGCFVTGIDTGVGKTLVAGALLLQLAQSGLRTGALKPVAAGAFRQGDQWVNEDGLELARLSSADQAYQEVNPVVLEAAIAPHIAAAQQGRPLLLDELVGAAVAGGGDRIAGRGGRFGFDSRQRSLRGGPVDWDVQEAQACPGKETRKK